MADQKSHHFEWNIWIQWILATTVGLIVSDSLSIFIPLVENIAILVPGVIIGTSQWLFILRFRISHATRWIWSTFVGWTVGWVLGMLVGTIVNLITILATGGLEANPVINAGSSLGGMAVLLVVHGTLLGIAQWLFVIRRQFDGAVWWILANATGWPLANGLSWGVIFPLVLNSDWTLSGLVDSAIRGMIFGAITGGMLAWLLQQPQFQTNTINTEEVFD